MANEVKQTGLRAFNQTITSPATQKYLADVLGERKGSFVNNLTALVANNANLQECEPYTLMFAAMKATALNLPLDPSLGMAFCIPYKNTKRGVTEAQFQIGAKGFKQLALRTGRFKRINVTDVREGELAGRNRLTGEMRFRFEDDDEKRLKLPIIGYCSYFILHDGYESTLYMSKEEVMAHGKRYSQMFRSDKDYIRNKSLWVADFDDMALKTVLKLNISRNAPLSVEMQDAMQADQAVIRDNGKYDYVDNEQQILDAQKAQDVAEKFADFDNAEEV